MTVTGLRLVATTLWPAASAAFANSTPMPRPALVMNQVLFSVMDGQQSADRAEVGVPLDPGICGIPGRGAGAGAGLAWREE
jgi:hypothetical protein